MAEFPDPYLRSTVEVPASVEDVWAAWTTEAGIRSFFAPECRVELEPGGPYEVYFRPDAPTGERGGEGNVVLAFREPEFLSFTWNAPPERPDVRRHRTVVTIRIEPASPVGDPSETGVVLTHLGWPPGEAWNACREYFADAWRDVVLPQLEQRFRDGPIDWNKR